jgi:diadenosine tetraphosphate (Ap4A) HIT family hydrolase
MSDVGPTLFTRIIQGELPGRFVWRDDHVVAFLTIEPIRPGHTLVVPVTPVDQWIDLEPSTWLAVNEVALAVGRAISEAFQPTRVGSIIAGMEVPHCHVHLVPIDSEGELSFALADRTATPEDLDSACERIRSVLLQAGHETSVPTD